MKRYEFTLSIGFAGAVRREVFEYEDDVTEDDLEVDYIEWRNNYLDGGWHEVKAG